MASTSYIEGVPLLTDGAMCVELAMCVCLVKMHAALDQARPFLLFIFISVACASCFSFFYPFCIHCASIFTFLYLLRASKHVSACAIINNKRFYSCSTQASSMYTPEFSPFSGSYKQCCLSSPFVTPSVPAPHNIE